MEKEKPPYKMTNAKEFNVVEIFDKDDKLIDGNRVKLRNLMSIKCYIKYWRHFASKRHGLH